MKDKAKRLRGCADRLADQLAAPHIHRPLSSPTPGALVLPSMRVSNACHSTEITLASPARRLGTLDVSFRASANVAASETAETRPTRKIAVYHLRITPSELERRT
jgi:hypothetical protein